MDRHVIANMGAELGATTTVFPADDAVREFLRGEGREEDFTELVADSDADYDLTDEIDLSTLEPLIARPSSQGNVVPVREVAGTQVNQVVLGSSANPGCVTTRSWRRWSPAARPPTRSASTSTPHPGRSSPTSPGWAPHSI